MSSKAVSNKLLIILNLNWPVHHVKLELAEVGDEDSRRRAVSTPLKRPIGDLSGPRIRVKRYARGSPCT